MFKFGFELEGFYRDNNGFISLPPSNYPTDGFPGLVELRTTSPSTIQGAFLEILGLSWDFKADYNTSEYTFPKDLLLKIRGRQNIKDAVQISNIYGKSPRYLNNKTIASFQINISKEKSSSYYDKNGVHIPATYEIFDFVPIIRRLDKEFEKDIKESGRQQGFYSIKDGCRVEYRSLPNSSFLNLTPQGVTNRIKRAVYGED